MTQELHFGSHRSEKKSTQVKTPPSTTLRNSRTDHQITCKVILEQFLVSEPLRFPTFLFISSQILGP